jgi:hypothetical protein
MDERTTLSDDDILTSFADETRGQALAETDADDQDADADDTDADLDTEDSA